MVYCDSGLPYKEKGKPKYLIYLMKFKIKL